MKTCPECDAVWSDDETCGSHFHQMLFWEHEDPANQAVHHLMVLSYYLQHPGQYSPDGLKSAVELLKQFIETDVTPQEIRQQNAAKVDSGNRAWKITATAGAIGRYPNPITWTMTAADVVLRGKDSYCENIRAWAESIYDALSKSGNI